MNLMFLGQAMMFIMCKNLWSKYEGNLVNQATNKARTEANELDDDKREEMAAYIHRYVSESLVLHGYYKRYFKTTMTYHIIVAANIFWMAYLMWFNFVTSNSMFMTSYLRQIVTEPTHCTYFFQAL